MNKCIYEVTIDSISQSDYEFEANMMPYWTIVLNLTNRYQIRFKLCYKYRLFTMSFWCCGSQEPEYKYEVKSLVNDEHGSPRETFKYYNSLEEVDHLEKENENVSITKVKTQLGLKDLQNEIRKKGEKFTDHTFPPDATSLGNIPGIIYWKRIP